MLESIRKLAEHTLFKALLALVVISFIILGIGDVFKSNKGEVVAVIDKKHKITIQEYNQALRSEIANLENAFHMKLTSEQLDQLNIKNMVLQQLINSKILEIESANLGLKISNETAVDHLKSQKAFQDDKGNFDRKKFDQIIAMSGLSEKKYINLIKKDLSTQFLMKAIALEHLNQDLFAPYAYLYNSQERLVDLITIDPKDLVSLPKPTQEDLKKYYDDNLKLFAAPEYRSFDYLELSSKDLAPSINIDEDELKKEYEELASDYQNNKFGEVKVAIREKLIRQKSDVKLYELMQEIDDEISSGATLEEISTKYNLAVKHKADIANSALSGNDYQLIENAFASDHLNMSSVTMKPDNSGFFVLKLLKITSPTVKPLNEVIAQVTDKWKEATIAKLATEEAEKLRNQLIENKNLTESSYKFAIDHNVRVKRDDSSLPASLVLEIFKLNLEGLTSIVPNEGKLMIAKLHEITNKKLDQKDPKYLELVNKLKGDFSNEALGSYLSYLRKKYRIQVNY